RRSSAQGADLLARQGQGKFEGSAQPARLCRVGEGETSEEGGRRPALLRAAHTRSRTEGGLPRQRRWLPTFLPSSPLPTAQRSARKAKRTTTCRAARRTTTAAC